MRSLAYLALVFLLQFPLSSRVGAQGTVFFYNRVPTVGIDAPVLDVGGQARLNGSHFFAQLYAGKAASSLSPVGLPSPFRFGEGAGYWGADGASLVRIIAGVEPGSEAFVQVRVYSIVTGLSYESVQRVNGKHGESDILKLTTGGDTKNGAQPPSLPAYLESLKPFELRGTDPFSPIIPEPGTLAFLLLAALGICAVRRGEF